MKSLRFAAVLAPLALSLSCGASAAQMESNTRQVYMKECVSTVTTEAKLDQAAAQKHCDCGAEQIEKSFTPKEMASLNDPSSPPSQELTERLQKLVLKNCSTAKK